MNKFSLDYQTLSDAVDKKRYKLSDVQDRIEKVAFDVVRFKDGNLEELWQIQNAEDGDYIVALYQDTEEKKSEASDWQVGISKISQDLVFNYKGEFLTKMASSKLGLSKEELNKTISYLPKKLAENKKLVQALLQELNEDKRQEICKKYPELL